MDRILELHDKHTPTTQSFSMPLSVVTEPYGQDVRAGSKRTANLHTGGLIKSHPISLCGMLPTSAAPPLPLGSGGLKERQPASWLPSLHLCLSYSGKPDTDFGNYPKFYFKRGNHSVCLWTSAQKLGGTQQSRLPDSLSIPASLRDWEMQGGWVYVIRPACVVRAKGVWRDIWVNYFCGPLHCRWLFLSILYNIHKNPPMVCIRNNPFCSIQLLCSSSSPTLHPLVAQK